MRFTLLTPGTGHFYCGSCLRDDALGRALRGLGHEVDVVPLYLPLVLERDEAPAAQVQMGGINVYLQQKARAFGWLPRSLRDLLDSPRLLRWAARRGNMTAAHELGELTTSILRGEDGRQRQELDKLVAWLGSQPRPDVVIVSNAMLVGVVRRLREALGVPVVVTLQGEVPFLDALPAPFREEAYASLRARALEADALVAVSASYRDEVQARLDLPDELFHVVHNGIEVEDFGAAATSRPGAPTIGFLARMCADKGLDTLVDAFLLLKARGEQPSLRLRVAGVQLDEDRSFVDALRDRIARAGHAADVDFLPNISRAEKVAFLHTLTALSVPARYGESFGLYLLEAMAAGIPVVQPRTAAFPEILAATGGGILCDPEDPAALADGLEALLVDPERAAALGARGQQAVRERFRSRQMAARVADICSALGSGRPD